MKPADLALLRTPGVPTISPDGRHAVVAVTRLDLDANDYRAPLWIVATDGSTPPRQLTHGWRDSAPAFSPDGRWLAFLRAEQGGKSQLHVMPTDGGDAWQVTTRDDHPLGAGEPVWSPDSTRLAYSARVPEPGRYGTVEKVTPDKEPPRHITTFRYRLDNLGFTLDRCSQVFVLDPFAAEPAPVRLTDGDRDHTCVIWSPDSARIAFITERHADRDTTLWSDLFSCAPDGSDLRQITDTSLSVETAAFGPDGHTVYLVAEELGTTGRDFVARPNGLFSVPVSGGTPTRLTVEEDVELVGTLRPVVVDDGLLVAREHRGAVELALVPFEGGRPQPVIAGSRQVKGYAEAAGVIAASVADGLSMGELVVLRDGAEHTLTDFGAELTATGRLHPLTEITATAPDGYPVHGWVVRPEGAGPHPVLLMIHGGPYTQYGWTLFDEAQIYASAGYAVVMGNPRGSSGYGRAHGLAIKGDVGERSAVDLLALLDHALREPDLDGTRLGVMGGSHGGFMTTWLIGHTDRFTAAVSERAVNAVDSFTGSSDIGWFFGEELYGPDPANRQRQSPLTHAERINTPTLIIHSEHDWRCPVEQAQRLYVALKSRGVPTELLLFPGEGHELTRSGLPSHRVARFETILDWWSRRL